MPGLTPNFGIRYPCAGEIIDPGVFQDFAEDVEAALDTVNAAGDFALLRPRGAQRTALTGTSTAVGVTTTMSYSTTDFNDDLTISAGGFTVVTDGVYMVDCQFQPITTVTTVTSFAGHVLQNAVVNWRRKLGQTGPPTTADAINVSGLLDCTAGDTVTAQWVWTGTGGPMFVYSRLSMSFICRS